MKKNNYNTTFTAENTIACRNNGGNDYRAKGATNGSYIGKAPTVRNLYRVDDTLLREVTTYKGTVYELVLDDEVYNRFPSLKEVTVWFIDFAGITKAKLNKAACA